MIGGGNDVGTFIDQSLQLSPPDHVSVEIQIPAEWMTRLIEDVTYSVTLTGDDLPLGKAYVRDFPERLTWHDTFGGRAWEVSRDVLLHMIELKRERGISHYRGIPIKVSTDGSVRARWVPISMLAALLAEKEGG